MRAGSSTSLGSGFELSTSYALPLSEEVVKKIRGFSKFFCNRLAQILVQSRTNERFDLPCHIPPPGMTDWFNVRVEELGEVSAQLKRNVQRFPPDVSCFTVDFLLYTADGDTLPLESWSFSLDDERKIVDDSCPMLYHEVGVLLRSAMCAARFTPMHRYYVKRQGPDTFVILYRLVDGPSTIDLGTEAKRTQLGSYPTPLGSLNLDLAYRTKMEIERRVEHLPPTDSFQQLHLVTPGTTPDSAAPVFGLGSPVDSPGTPGSFSDVISNFSTSPPSVATSPPNSYAISPPNTPFQVGSMPFQVGSAPPNLCYGAPPSPFIRRARSRTQSARSNTSIDSNDSHSVASEKMEQKKVSQSQIIAKDMPFAHLLSMSFTGALYPLHTLKEEGREHDESQAKEQDKEQDVTLVGEHSSLLPFEMETSVSASTVVASTVCDTVQNSHHEDHSDNSENESSFVKIPCFGSASDDSLADFIHSLKAPSDLVSYDEQSNMNIILDQVGSFAREKYHFDEFVAEVNEKMEQYS